jgi:hypothetical protein
MLTTGRGHNDEGDDRSRVTRFSLIQIGMPAETRNDQSRPFTSVAATQPLRIACEPIGVQVQDRMWGAGS